jgi:hypothetical protein
LEISRSDRTLIGCKAVSGIPVRQISKFYGVNREFVYEQKRIFEEQLRRIDFLDFDDIVVLNKKMKEKIIIACMLVCKGSEGDTVNFLKYVFDIDISKTTISRIINDATIKARKFNSEVDLSLIKIGSHDEIFQGGVPVLVGVANKENYIYLMEGVENRDSTTWGYHILKKMDEQNLNLDTVVSDAGSGLLKGIKEASPHTEQQSDTFHVGYELSIGVSQCENDAYRTMRDFEETEKKKLKNSKKLQEAQKKKIRKSIKKKKKQENNEAKLKELEIKETLELETLESKALELNKKCEDLKEKSDKKIKIYDKLCILYVWIVQLLMVGGYFYDERIELFSYIIEEYESTGYCNHYINKAFTFLKGNLPNVLKFVKKAEMAMEKLALDENIPIEVLKLMWIQLRHSTDSSEYNIIEAKIGILLGKRYIDVRNKWDIFLEDIVRASSIVENVNSRLRPYLSLKKVVPNGFLDLIQFYFNTKEYRRSRKVHRIGKSPLEMLTGKKYPNPLELLGSL